MQPNRFGDLVQRIRRRLWVAAVLQRSVDLTILLVVILALSLVAHRLFGWGPDWASSAGLAAVVLASATALALLLAWGTTPRQDDTAAARRLDEHCRSKDLFLTRALLGPACGDYKPLVAARAEARAARVDPGRVVPVELGSRAFHAGVGLAILFLGTVFLPQLDLLGHQAGSRQVAARQRALQEQKKLAIKKSEVLRKRDVQSKVSKPLQASLEELRKSLRAMQRDRPRRNAKELDRQRRSLGAQWRQAKSGSGLQSRGGADRQSLGSLGKGKAQEWARDLRRGDDGKLRKELRELREVLDKLAQTKSDLEKQKLAAELADRLQELKDLAREAGSNDLDEAISRLLQQLQIAQLEGLSPELLEALRSTLELSQLELDQLAQQMRDIKALEQALEALQLAGLLNQLEALDLDALDAKALAQAENMDPEELQRLLKQMLASELARLGECKGCSGGG